MPESTAQESTQGTNETHESQATNDAGGVGGSETVNSNSLEAMLSALGETERKAILSEVHKARGEAAGYRTKLREVEPLAAEAQKVKDAQKSDVEKLTERITTAEHSSSAKDLQIARLSAVLEHGLTTDDVKFLNGATAEEIAEQAKLFAERLGAGKTLSGKPKESLKSGVNRDDENDPDENDPVKLADKIRARQYG